MDLIHAALRSRETHGVRIAQPKLNLAILAFLCRLSLWPSKSADGSCSEYKLNTDARRISPMQLFVEHFAQGQRHTLLAHRMLAVLVLSCIMSPAWCTSSGFNEVQQQRFGDEGSRGADAARLSAVQLFNLLRCYGVRGSHCSGYYSQRYIALKHPTVHNKKCLNSCSGKGICNGDTGLCDCPAGVGGADCSKPDLRPCTNGYRKDKSSSDPASHIGANKRDANWSASGWTPSRCAGVCDDTTGICYCDGPHFGRVPAPDGSPAGSPPIRQGRLLHGGCQRLTNDDKGQNLDWGVKGMPYDAIYGAQGWCTVDTPRVRCSCDIDGVDGELCELVTEMVCPNQCSGHGECIRGFCSCFDGWYGLDCARLSNSSVLEMLATAAESPAAADGTQENGRKSQQEDEDQAVDPTTKYDEEESEGAAIAGDVAVVAEAALQIDKSEGDNAAEHLQDAEAADRIAAAAAAAAAALPPHLRFLFERPHLSNLVVDAWTRTTTSVEAVAAQSSSTGNTSSVGMFSVNTEEQQHVLLNLAAHGGLSEAAAAAATAPPIPDIYFTPLREVGSEGSSLLRATEKHRRRLAGVDSTTLRDDMSGASDASGDQQQLPGQQKQQLTHQKPEDSKPEATPTAVEHVQPVYEWSTAADVSEVHQQQQQSQLHHAQPTDAVEETVAELAAAVQAAASVANATATAADSFAGAPEHEHELQLHSLQQQNAEKQLFQEQQSQVESAQHEQSTEQQQLQSAAESLQQRQSNSQRSVNKKPSRHLLRHMWTGGGSRRGTISIAPQQDTVTAAVQAWLSESAPSSSGSNSSHDSSTAALQQALVAAGVQMDQLTSAVDAELLQHMIEAGMSAVPQGKARRPRIFVYDMPSRFVGRLLQYRPSKQTCTWRIFSKSNFSLYTTTESDHAWRYPLESHLHELMLQSPHRTLDPEEADYFYVPVYASCFMEAVAGWADAPWWQVQSRSMIKQGVGMYMNALDWIRITYPYWNATNGANHIWLFAHDEGACWAPTEVYNNSIILSQWGRLPTTQDMAASRDNSMTISTTSRWEYNFNKGDDNDDPHMPGGYIQHIGTHPCYTPGKDIVLPAFKPPPRFHASPFLGGDSRRSRDILLLLRTDLGANRPPAFSQGVRQELAGLAKDGKWKSQYRIWVGTEKELEGDYSVLLSRSRFCLVVPRDGWSGLFEDAVLHGCIPVVVSGGSIGNLVQPFSAVLRLSTAVLKVRAEELQNLPTILAGITDVQEQALRQQLYKIWHRFAWLTHPWVREQAEGLVADNLRKHTWVKDELNQQLLKQKQALSQMGRQPGSNATISGTGLFDTQVWSQQAVADDAFTTLMQWLHYKMLRPYNASAAASRQYPQAARDSAVTVEKKRKQIKRTKER